MSTPAATARYVIVADDKTGSAIKSILGGFKDVDKSVRGISKTFNDVLGVVIGVKLVQGLKRVVDVTAQSAQGQKGFALALEQVKGAATDLLAATSDLPKATENLNELREILQDPALRAAADAITSTLIKGFTESAKAIGQTVAGLRELGVQQGMFAPRNDQEMIDRNEKVIRDLEARRDQLARAPQGRILKGDYAFDAGSSKAQVNEINAAIERLKAENEFLQTIGAVKIDVPDLKLPRIYSKEELELMEDVERARKAHLNDKITDAGGLLAIDPKQLENTRGDYEGFFKDIKASAEDSFKDISKVLDGEAKEWSVYADQAARNMQDAFADFLFDPFKHGVRGLLQEFIDVLRRMVAEAAAAKIFEALFGKKDAKNGGGNALGGLLGAIFGGAGSAKASATGSNFMQGENDWWWSKVFKQGGGWSSILGAIFGGGKAEGGPLQQGKWYIAGERGPEPIWGGGPGAFAMGYGGGGGGMTFAPVYNIDARGASRDLVDALPEILRRNNEQVKQDILGGIQRRKYPVPR